MQTGSEVCNILDPAIIAIRVKLSILENLDKIIQVDGLNPSLPAGQDGKSRQAVDSGSGNLAKQIVTSALRYRGQAPLIDAILKQIGMNGGDINGTTETLHDKIQSVDSATPEADSQS